MTPTSVSAHSGRTDSSGGHNCSAKSIAKGLCSGYHYHNGGYTSDTTYVSPTTAPVKTATPVRSKSPSPTLKPTETPVPASPSSLATSEPAAPEVAGASTEESGWDMTSLLVTAAGVGVIALALRKPRGKNSLSH